MGREAILREVERLIEAEKMLADPTEARKKLEIKYQEKYERLIDVLRVIDNEDTFKELLLRCPNQRSYEFLARALERVIGPARVIEIETR